MQVLRPETKSPKAGWTALLGYAQAFQKIHALAKSEALPPVILWHGPSGLGKTTALKGIAAALFCEKGIACGSCFPCRLIEEGRHPDVLFIESAPGKSIKIQDLLVVNEHLSQFPATHSPLARRVLCIGDAERLSEGAVNRLLKTLEEPSSSAFVCLSTSKLRELLPTLRSRCVPWRIPPLSGELWNAFIEKHKPMQPEAIGCYPELVRKSGGSPGRLLAELKKLSDPKEAELHRAILSLLSHKDFYEALSAASGLARTHKVDMSRFFTLVEGAISEEYREALHSFSLDERRELWLKWSERRRFLASLKKTSLNGRIALNAQLGLEVLGLMS